MSEYLAYTLWRQREERMSHELEQLRVVKERLNEQAQEQRLREAGLEAVQEQRSLCSFRSRIERL